MSDFSRLPPVDARLLHRVLRRLPPRVRAGPRRSRAGCSGWTASRSPSSRSAESSPTTCCSAFRSRRSRWATRRCPVVSMVLVFNSLLAVDARHRVDRVGAHAPRVARGFRRHREERRDQPGRRQHPDRHGVGLARHSAARDRGPDARPHRPGGDPAVADRAGDGPRRVRRARRLAREHGDLRASSSPCSRSSSTRSPACSALPPLETRAIVLLASLPVGANVYLMAREFGVARRARSPRASCCRPLLAAVTTPIVLALMSGG